MTEAECVTGSRVEKIPIDKIVIGTRRRQKMKGVGGLARSIRLHGLVHPILVRNGNELVAGLRRLEACKRLEWKTIPARHVDELSDEEMRIIELDENTEREALTDFETAKARLAEIRQIEAKLKAEAGALTGGSPTTESPRRHRATGKARGGSEKKAGSKRATEAEGGVSRKTRSEMERHVALAERFPFLQRPDWVRHTTLQAGDWLEQLSEDEQSASAALLDQDCIPPNKTLAMLESLVKMPAERRTTIFTKARSSDEYERRTALTMAANLPPPPDPGLSALQESYRSLQRSQRCLRTVEFKPDIAREVQHLEALVDKFLKRVDEQRSAAYA